MSTRNARKLAEVHRLVGKAWAQGGIVTGSDPCVEDRARQVGLSVGVLRRHGINWRWNDRQPSRTGARNVQRALKRAIAREGGCAQPETKATEPKTTRKRRQHMGVAPALGLVAALMLVAVVAAHLAAVLLVISWILAVVAFAAGVRLWYVAGVPLVEWIDEHAAKATARGRARRVAVETRQAEVLTALDERASLFALPAGPAIDPMAAWLHPVEGLREAGAQGVTRDLYGKDRL